MGKYKHMMQVTILWYSKTPETVKGIRGIGLPYRRETVARDIYYHYTVPVTEDELPYFITKFNDGTLSSKEVQDFCEKRYKQTHKKVKSYLDLFEEGD